MTTVNALTASRRTGRPRGPRVTVACAVCGSAFALIPSQVGAIRTCSPECRRQLPALRAQQRRGPVPEGLPDLTPPSQRHVTTRETRTCAICVMPFLVAPKSERTTCSAKCHSERRSRVKSEGITTRTCKTCGNDFTIKIALLRARSGDYCSDGCRIAGLNSLPRKPAQMSQCRICGKAFPCPPNFKRPDDDRKTRGIYCSRACMWTDDDYRKRRAVRHSPSDLETWLFAVLDAEGVPYEKFATVGRYVPDALLTGYRVIIEVDGVIWHRRKVAYDQQRDRDLTAAGYTVMHFTSIELTSAKAAKRILGAAIADIRAGRATYRPPLLWKPGREPGPILPAASAGQPTQDS